MISQVNIYVRDIVWILDMWCLNDFSGKHLCEGYCMDIRYVMLMWGCQNSTDVHMVL